jgi:hypothetical protein
LGYLERLLYQAQAKAVNSLLGLLAGYLGLSLGPPPLARFARSHPPTATTPPPPHHYSTRKTYFTTFIEFEALVYVCVL